jgi:hypothetical protein
MWCKRSASQLLHFYPNGTLANKIQKQMAKHSSSSRSELEGFLTSLDLPNQPAIHVNGKEHPTAVVVVDFGSPLEPVRLNPELSQELASKLRKFTRDIITKEANIRVGSDNYNGVVYWSSIQ